MQRDYILTPFKKNKCTKSESSICEYEMSVRASILYRHEEDDDIVYIDIDYEDAEERRKDLLKRAEYFDVDFNEHIIALCPNDCGLSSKIYQSLEECLTDLLWGDIKFTATRLGNLYIKRGKRVYGVFAINKMYQNDLRYQETHPKFKNKITQEIYLMNWLLNMDRGIIAIGDFLDHYEQAEVEEWQRSNANKK